MGKPLLITDCDEVLLHFIAPFHGWIGEIHDIDFSIERCDFYTGMRRKACGSPVEQREAFAIFNQFFTDEMHRQPIAPGAAEALAAIGTQADVVVLTNLPPGYEALRTRQLQSHGLELNVTCNIGPKGPALKRLLDQYQPTAAVFVDDLAEHHESVAQAAPDVHRLHMIAEPLLAPHIPPASAAHARIDSWREALPWITKHLGLQMVNEKGGS